MPHKNHQGEDREFAAQSFLESLNQLEETLQKPIEEEKVVDPQSGKTEWPISPSQAQKTEKGQDMGLDLSLLEDAAEDIEKFIQSHRPELLE
jgi:hypothetical protein